jgi:LysM repeat protein
VIEVLSKKSLIILMLAFGTMSIAEDIKLVDESGKSNLVQKEIVGCDESLVKQNRDLDEIKKQLAFILKKLSQLENKDDTKQKSKDISNIKNCLSQLTKEKKTKEKKEIKRKKFKKQKKDHTIVVVERGDSLSSYAKKYYGDKKKYYRIYRANKDKIAEDLQLIIGDIIIIPLSPNYKYKKFKRIKHVVKKKKTIPKKFIVKKPITKYPMAKIFTKPKSNANKIDMLDEPIFVDDENIDNSGFLPLDDN